MDKVNKKQLKKIKKFIKKQWKIEVDIKLSDTLINLSERIAIKMENCSLQDAYKKWIISPKLHLPGWICVCLVSEFIDNLSLINQNNTVKEMFDKM